MASRRYLTKLTPSRDQQTQEWNAEPAHLPMGAAVNEGWTGSRQPLRPMSVYLTFVCVLRLLKIVLSADDLHKIF